MSTVPSGVMKHGKHGKRGKPGNPPYVEVSSWENSRFCREFVSKARWNFHDTTSVCDHFCVWMSFGDNQENDG